jgi:modulator of FtsH protease HflC
MSRILALSLVVVLGGIGLSLSTIVSRQGEVTVVQRFGKPVRIIAEPGLHWKLPAPIDRPRRLDARLAIIEPRPTEFLTADKKNVVLAEAICYRIVDPILFIKTVRDVDGLELRLTDLLTSFTGMLLGQCALDALVNVDRGQIAFEDLVADLTTHLRNASTDLGIRVERVFIKQIMLPEQNKAALYQRMRAERNRIARKYSAEGEEQALRVRADADLASRTILAEAEHQAEIIRGTAEAEAMRIYGDTYRGDLPFYRFVRSLEAYQKIFSEQSTIILDEQSPLLEALQSGGRELPSPIGRTAHVR